MADLAFTSRFLRFGLQIGRDAEDEVTVVDNTGGDFDFAPDGDDEPVDDRFGFRGPRGD
jgi:hypothetical protein